MLLLVWPALTNTTTIKRTNEIDKPIDGLLDDANRPAENGNVHTDLDFNNNKQAKNESEFIILNAQTKKENESFSKSAYTFKDAINDDPTDKYSFNNGGDDVINVGQYVDVKIDRHLENKRRFRKEDESDPGSTLSEKRNMMDDKIKEHGDFKKNSREIELQQKQIIDNAIDYGMKALEELVTIKEPLLYKLGLFLEENHPAARVAKFGEPINQKAILMSRFGIATLEASKKIAESYPENVGWQSAGIPNNLQSKIDLDECPIRGRPRCPSASKRFRTSDGTCNNPEHSWRGAAMLPMQRFIAPVYEDGIQSVRHSIFGPQLPLAREISTNFHRDKNQEIQSVTLMFTQWGQFLDHDITSTVKSRSFNGTIPRCCEGGGRRLLPPQLLHPSCLPMEVPSTDPFLSPFGIGCMEFIRSAPSTRIDCELGWREQINQVTPYIDASTIYGSDVDTSDSIRTFRNGRIIYGRPHDQGPLNPPDPPGGELCRSGGITKDCLAPGDTRVGEQPGLIAMHTVFVRYHNKVATVLAKINPHWSDERVFQETRRIVYSVVQHITYREFLPIVLGPEVVDLFELKLVKKGYFEKYNKKVNPAIANSFSAAAFRFGHSMVQNSYVRTDSHHVPIFNNVSLHEEFENIENIWSEGSTDRLLLGLCNQPSQRRDEFIAEELTHHLFQFSNAIPFGMDLAAINIQRGRDHGIPPYTIWRKPCGLTPIESWQDLEKVMSIASVMRLKSLYLHVDDIDLFTGGLAEKPLRGAVVGPTFACIIAQQFSNLRKGDRFWYENGEFESSFTPLQLQQIRKTSLAQIICQTMDEIETIQPFVFLSVDSTRNDRLACDSSEIRNFDLQAWAEKSFDFNRIEDTVDTFEAERSYKDSTKRQNRFIRAKRKTKTTTRRPRPLTTTKTKTNATTKKLTKQKLSTLKPTTTNSTTRTIETKYGDFNDIPQKPTFTVLTTSKPTKTKPQYYQIKDQSHNDVTYLLGLVPEHVTKIPSVQVNINIHYSPSTATVTTVPLTRPNTNKKKRPNLTKPSLQNDYISDRPSVSINRPINSYGQGNVVRITKKPVTNRPPVFIHSQSYDNVASSQRPGYYFTDNMVTNDYDNIRPSININDIPFDNIYSNKPMHNYDYDINEKPSYVHRFGSQNTYTADRPTAFEPLPFSSSNRPVKDYSNKYYFDRGATKRPYTNYFDNDDDTVTISNNKRRPVLLQTNPYHRDDDESTTADDISELFYSGEDRGGTKSFGNSGTKGVGSISDKLDFKSRDIFKKIGKYDSENDGRFVKIYSVKKEEFYGMNVGILDVEQREEPDVKIGKRQNRRVKKIRVLEIDVLPSESRNQWTVFDPHEEPTIYNMEMPEFQQNIPCSYEVPKPIEEFYTTNYKDKDQIRRYGQ